MKIRTALLHSLLAVVIAVLSVLYSAFIVPQDGIIDLRESVITIFSLIFAALILIHAWWALGWNRLMLAVEKHKARKTGKPEAYEKNQYSADQPPKTKNTAGNRRGRRRKTSRKRKD